jgi:hypothetical protein
VELQRTPPLAYLGDITCSIVRSPSVLSEGGATENSASLSSLEDMTCVLRFLLSSLRVELQNSAPLTSLEDITCHLSWEYNLCIEVPSVLSGGGATGLRPLITKRAETYPGPVTFLLGNSSFFADGLLEYTQKVVFLHILK